MKKLIPASLCILIIFAVFVFCKAKPAQISLEPNHLDMLVSLDGEEDDYYEELILKCNGIRVKAEKVKWHSDDPGIAEVDKYGWVTSMGVGKTTITAEYRGSCAECTVEVTQKITSDTLGE